VSAAIGLAGAAFEQAARLERVNQPDHAARRNAQALAHRLLRAAFIQAHPAQQRELAGLELERRQSG
jgi:hypothetical protein